MTVIDDFRLGKRGESYVFIVCIFTTGITQNCEADEH